MRRLAALALALLVLSAGGCLELTETRADPVGTDQPPRDTYPSNTTLSVHYLDVGQADATLLEFPNGETMLVDSGDWRQNGTGVLVALAARDVNRLDHLVATHPHADHVGGHEAVVEHFETEAGGVGAAYDSGVAHASGTFEEYLDAVEGHDVALYTVRAGDAFAVGNATVAFLNPPAERTTDELHPNSVSLVVTYGASEFLFTGDLEAPGERSLVANRSAAIDADVYQAGHHGSRTSSSPAFLDAVSPDVAVISSALDSQYGHPHGETLAALADRDVETYWTTIHGDVTVRTNGSTLAIEAERDAPTDPAAIRDARDEIDEADETTPAIRHPGSFVGPRPTVGV